MAANVGGGGGDGVDIGAGVRGGAGDRIGHGAEHGSEMHRGGASLVGDEIPGPGGQSVDGEHTSKVPLPLYSLLLLLSSINHKPHTPHCFCNM